MKKIIATILMMFSMSANAITFYAYNITQHQPIVDSEIGIVRPIASITKLMTAIVVLESGLSLNERISYKGMFYSHKKFTRDELLNLMLVKSDNRAAEALAEGMGGKLWTVYQMNKRAMALGMYDSNFDDTSGLSAKNTSTAKDLVTLLTYVYQNDKIREISALSKYDLTVVDKKNKEKHIPVNNTNLKLMTKYDIIEVSKTGTTNAAGKCLVMVVHKNGDRIAIVILGGKTRTDVDNLAKRIIEQII
jgi:D-alanyl-D-alanine endopeptidase (penicillin-binding protein 7)